MVTLTHVPKAPALLDHKSTDARFSRKPFEVFDLQVVVEEECFPLEFQGHRGPQVIDSKGVDHSCEESFCDVTPQTYGISGRVDVLSTCFQPRTVRCAAPRIRLQRFNHQAARSVSTPTAVSAGRW
jgi:hypothetical protein